MADVEEEEVMTALSARWAVQELKGMAEDKGFLELHRQVEGVVLRV